jgi:hypothetical protein
VSEENEKTWTIRNGDCLSGIVLLGLALYLVFEALKLPFGTVARPGPGFYPTLLAVMLVGMSGAVFFHSLRSAAGLFQVRFLARSGHIGITFAAIVVYAALLEPLGFLLCTFVLVLMLLVGIGKVTWRRSILVSAVGTIVVYLIFTWLGIPLPKGIFAL